MSVQTQIDRIKANIASAYTKAQEKGAELPSVQNSANLPATIEAIPSCEYSIPLILTSSQEIHVVVQKDSLSCEADVSDTQNATFFLHTPGIWNISVYSNNKLVGVKEVVAPESIPDHILCYSLEVSPDPPEGGSVDSVDRIYWPNDTVSLHAHANSGYEFNGWYNEGESQKFADSDVVSISMDGNKKILAHFTETSQVILPEGYTQLQYITCGAPTTLGSSSVLTCGLKITQIGGFELSVKPTGQYGSYFYNGYGVYGNVILENKNTVSGYKNVYTCIMLGLDTNNNLYLRRASEATSLADGTKIADASDNPWTIKYDANDNIYVDDVLVTTYNLRKEYYSQEVGIGTLMKWDEDSNKMIRNGGSINQIYSFKAYNLNGELVRNLIPAKRQSDGKIGMYDLSGNTFYTSTNSSDFIAGPEA